MQKSLSYIAFIIIFLYSCTRKENLNVTYESSIPNIKTGWDVPTKQIAFSSFPPDRIQSIDSPHFELINNENLKSFEIAYVYRHNDIIKVYPENILAVHEIINNIIDEHSFCISLCPLTGSAMAWNREIDGQVTEFGVSGHLFNDNLIPYDRNSNSFWSQMQFTSIKGKYSGNILENEFLLKTIGSTIFESFPSALVLIDTLSHSCDSACSESKKNTQLEIREQKVNKSINSDYYGIIKKNIIHDDEALLFNMELFTEHIHLYQIKYYNNEMIVIGSKKYQFIIVFINNTNEVDIKFSAVQNELPIIMKDNLGNSYDITGAIIDGPRIGHRLLSPHPPIMLIVLLGIYSIIIITKFSRSRIGKIIVFLRALLL